MNSLFDITALGTRLDLTVVSMVASKSSQSFYGVALATAVQLERDVPDDGLQSISEERVRFFISRSKNVMKISVVNV